MTTNGVVAELEKNWQTPPVLRGRHVTVRPMGEEDREGLLAFADDREGWDDFLSGFHLHPNRENIDDWMRQAKVEQSWGRTIPMVVCRSDSGVIIGTTRFKRMNFQHRRLEIGSTMFASSARRTGANTETKHLMLTHAFETLKCNVIQIRCLRVNHRSRRAIERLGAIQDGILRRHAQTSDGQVHDFVVYSLIADEWPVIRSHMSYLQGQGGS